MKETCNFFLHSFYTNLYFIANILTFIILCLFLKEPNIFSDGCSLDLINNWDLVPISDIYLSNEKTSDSLKLGDLEEYSNEI